MATEAAVYVLGERGRVLVSRREGRELAAELTAGMGERSSVLISFRGVDVANAGFLAELLDAMVGALGAQETASVMVCDVHVRLRAPLRTAARRCRWALVDATPEQTDQLRQSASVRQRLWASHGPDTAEDDASALAARLATDMPVLHARLRQLQVAGMLAVSSEWASSHADRLDCAGLEGPVHRLLPGGSWHACRQARPGPTS